MRSTSQRSMGWFFIALGVGMIFGLVAGGHTSMAPRIMACVPVLIGAILVVSQHMKEVRAASRERSKNPF